MSTIVSKPVNSRVYTVRGVASVLLQLRDTHVGTSW